MLSLSCSWPTIMLDLCCSWPTIMLDLSAAFDTIDHNILTKCLSLWYGISGTALNWFLSYLTGRHQTIKIANCFSAAIPTSCDVPQGSVLGPLLFTLYTTPLSSVQKS